MKYEEWSKSIELDQTLTPNFAARDCGRTEEKIFEQKVTKGRKGRKSRLLRKANLLPLRCFQHDMTWCRSVMVCFLFGTCSNLYLILDLVLVGLEDSTPPYACFASSTGLHSCPTVAMAA